MKLIRKLVKHEVHWFGLFVIMFLVQNASPESIHGQAQNSLPVTKPIDKNEDKSALFLTADVANPNGNERCNPCVKDAIHAINTLRDRGETMGFHMSFGYPPLSGSGTKSHWQGIQRMMRDSSSKQIVVLSSSHRGQDSSHLAIVELASRDGRQDRLRSNRLRFNKLTRDVIPLRIDRVSLSLQLTNEYDHPGGMQAIGSYLLVGSDGNLGHYRNSAVFQLWNLSNPRSPYRVWEKELPGSNANSVGIVRLEDGRYLMLRAMGDAKALLFYILEDIGPELKPTIPFAKWELGNDPVYSDIGDNKWGDLGCGPAGIPLTNAGYQNTNLVAECKTGNIYLVATHGRCPAGGGADFVDLYKIDIPIEGGMVIVTKVAKRHMFPGDNADDRQGDLQAGAGVFISRNNKLYVYASEHGTTGPGGTVEMIEFGPQIPLDEVTFARQSWAELYEHDNFKGRSIILDLADENSRNYANFDRIEKYDNVASSILYCLAKGVELKLYQHDNQKGKVLTLVGTGKVEGITNLDDYGKDNWASSAQWILY